MPKTLLRTVWLIAVVLVVLWSCFPADSAPMKSLDQLDIGDKTEHFFAYLFLAFLPAIHERRNIALGSALAIVLLGISLEFAQIYFDRNFEVSDMFANICGVGTGLMAAGLFRRSGRPSYSI